MAVYHTRDYGKGYNVRSLWYTKHVYSAFPNLGFQIMNALRSLSFTQQSFKVLS